MTKRTFRQVDINEMTYWRLRELKARLHAENWSDFLSIVGSMMPPLLDVFDGVKEVKESVLKSMRNNHIKDVKRDDGSL